MQPTQPVPHDLLAPIAKTAPEDAAIVPLAWAYEDETYNIAVVVLDKVPLLLTRQPEGGYTVTSPLLPELGTEGDTLDAALAHVQDAAHAVVELYEDLGKPLPASILRPASDMPLD